MVAEVPYLQGKYELDKWDNSHFVEILPLSSYESDKFATDFEYYIYETFLKEYPYEGLSITGGNALHQIQQATYTKTGLNFIL